MAKMTKTLRRGVFERALLKIYGERFAEEENTFKTCMETVFKNQRLRIAKEYGVDYKALLTNYKPYVRVDNYLRFRLDCGNYFSNDLEEGFYNEHQSVLYFEDAHLPILKQYKNGDFHSYLSNNDFPHTGTEFCTDEERKTIIAVFKGYGDFMNEVIVSACAIRDIINSTSTTKQLEDILPELGDFIPEQKNCTALVSVETVEKVKDLFTGRRG